VQAIPKKNIQDKCLPRENNNEITPLKVKTTAVVISISDRILSLGCDKKYNIAAKPHQAIVVRCQANLKIRFVNQSLPSNLGKLSRLNKRINKYFSPRYE